MQRAAASTDAWLVARLGTRRCAIPVRFVIETMRPLPVDEIGRRQAGVLGLAQIRGGSVPVVDGAALFGGANEGGPSARFVTLRVGSRVIALAVDEVVGVREVAAAAWETLPSLVAGAKGDGVVQAIARADSDLVLALDASRVLPGEGA